MAKGNRTCANCAAWQAPDDEEAFGSCRANPPVLDHEGETCFPQTPPHWWCMKWVSRARRELEVIDPKKE